MKQFRINADDFGASCCINAAVKKAILQGAVTSVSVMTEKPYFIDAVTFLKKHPKVQVGLHFQLTKKETLFHLVKTVFTLSFRRSFQRSVTQELEKQYKKLHSTGLKVSHLDSHQHLHLHPWLFKLFQKFANQENIPEIRSSNLYTAQIILTAKKLFSLKGILLWILYGMHSPTKPGIIFDLNWYNSFSPHDMKHLIQNLPPNSEIICHLSYPNPKDQLSWQRYQYLEFLLTYEF